MPKYINLGKKEPDYGYDSPVSSTKQKMKIGYPHFHCSKELPISGKQVGKEVMARVRLEVKSVEKTTQDEKAPSYKYSFDIKEIKFDDTSLETSKGMEDKLKSY